MSFKAGSAYLELEGKDKGALKMLDKVEKKTGNIKKGLSGLTKAFIALGGALVIKDIITTYGQFEQAVSNAASVTGAFGKQLEKTKANITAVSKELGKTTVFSANEAASALYDLASAGEDVANITTKDIKPILDLAAATGTDLPTAMEQTLASMKQMGLGFKDVGDITDSLMATIASSPANMERLKGAWKAAAPIANALGVNFNELNAALGTLFSKGFLQGEQAGTALRNMFTRLVPSTKVQIDNLKALGLSAKDVSIEEHGLLGVLKTLKTSFDGLESKTARIAAAKKMFGEEAAGAAIALIMEADATKKLYDSMELMKKKAKETGQSLTEMIAKMQLDTMQGSLKLFTSNLESLKIAIGETLAPMIRTVAELLGSIAASEGIQKAFQSVFIIIREVVVGIIGVFTEWSNVIGQVFGGEGAVLLKGFSKGFEILGNTIKVVLGLITDFGVFVIKKLKVVVDFIQTKWGGELMQVFKLWIDYVKLQIGVFIYLFTAAFNKITEIFNNVLPFFIQIFDGLIKLVKGILQIFTGEFSKGFMNIINGTRIFMKGLILIIWEGIKQIAGFLDKVLGFTARTMAGIGKLIGALFVDLLLYVGGIIGSLMADAVTLADNLAINFENIDWGKVWSGMSEWYDKNIIHITDRAKEIGSKIAKFFSDIFSGKKADLKVSTTKAPVSSGEKKKLLKDFSLQIDPFNFSNTKKVLKDIGKDFKNTFLDVDTSKIEKAAKSVQDKIFATQKLANGNTLDEQTKIIDTLNTQNKLTTAAEKLNQKNTEAIKQGGSAGKTKNNNEKEANKQAISAYVEIGSKIKDSIIRIQKYGDNLGKLKEKFVELKDSALSNINEINNSIDGLNKKMADIVSAGQTKRGDIKTNADIELAKRRISILKEQEDINKKIKDYQNGTDNNKIIEINKLEAEKNTLAKELSLILEKVDKQLLDQVATVEKRTESERILAKLQSDINNQKIDEAKQLAKIEASKKILIEKKAISQAILDDKKIKIIQEGDVLKAFYTDSKGKEVEIKDFKNIQYAQDFENKRLVIQNQLLAVEAGILKEKELLTGFYESKKTMEKKYGELFAIEKEKQNKIIEREIGKTKQAIKLWNEYWKAKNSGSGNSNIGYVPEKTTPVAGISPDVMKNITGPGIGNNLDSMRKSAMGGNINTVSNSTSSNNLNVTQNISNGVDMQASIREMGYMLRLNA